MLISTEELDTEDTGDSVKWLIICSLCQKQYINSLYSQNKCGETTCLWGALFRIHTQQSIFDKLTNGLSKRVSWISQFWQQCIVIEPLERGYNFPPEVRIVLDSFNTRPLGCPHHKSHTSFSHILPCTPEPGSNNCGYALELVCHLQAVRGRF